MTSSMLAKPNSINSSSNKLEIPTPQPNFIENTNTTSSSNTLNNINHHESQSLDNKRTDYDKRETASVQVTTTTTTTTTAAAPERKSRFSSAPPPPPPPPSRVLSGFVKSTSGVGSLSSVGNNFVAASSVQQPKNNEDLDHSIRSQLVSPKPPQAEPSSVQIPKKPRWDIQG